MGGAADAQPLLLTISADTSKALKAIDNLNRRLSGVAPEMAASARKAAQGVEKELGNINVGQALRKVFDSSRLAVLEEGKARLRVAGSAIEPLGPLGLAAAAGVAALGVAFEEAHKAIEYADSLYKAAQAAHVSTDALQEYRAALIKAGGDAQAAGPALLQFSEIFGKAQAGLKRSERGFLALGFSKEDVQAFQTQGAALDAVVAKIQNLKKTSDQDAAISLFGLEGLKPLILAGADAWKTWREEAKASGQVLDKDVIRRGHELAVQMDELTNKIKNDLTTAFVNLGPVLVQLLGYVGQMLDKVKQFTDEVHKFPALGKLIGDVGAAPFRQALGGDAVGPIARDAAELYHQKTTRAEFGAPTTISKAALLAALGITPSGNGKLADLSAQPKGQDHTAEFDKSAADALNSGREAEAKALASLVDGIQAHADAEKALVDAGLTKKLADLEAEAQRIAAAKNDADKLAQRAKINSAKAAEREAAEIAKRVIDQKAATASLEQFLAYSQRIHGDYARIANDSAAMADTADQRNAIERRLLQDEQRNELFAFDQRAKDELSRLSGSDLESRRSQLTAERGATVDRQTADTALQAFNQAGPLDKYLHGLRDLNTEFQTDGVQAIQSLTAGLIDAALHARSLGDVVKNTFLTLLQQMLTQSLTKEAAPGLASGFSALLHFIPGFASGTPSAPGGLSLVGENGPELVNLPHGARVTPTFQTLDALSAMHAPSARGVTVIQPFHFHAEGAVLTEEILRQANGTAAQLAAQAGRSAHAAAVGEVRRAGYLGNINQ